MAGRKTGKTRMVVLAVLGCVVVAAAVGVPRYLGWREQLDTRRRLESAVDRINQLSQAPLVRTNRKAVQGVLGADGHRHEWVTDEASGWYKVTQRRLELANEITFLSERMDAVTQLASLAGMLPQKEGAHATEAVERFREAWRAIVPREIEDDVRCDWDALGKDINAALAELARELEKTE